MGYEPQRVESEYLGEQATIEVSLTSRASLGGSLRDRRGDPLANILVQLEVVELPSESARPSSILVGSDAAGRYNFPDLEPGRYAVSLSSGWSELCRSPAIEVGSGQAARHDFEVNTLCEVLVVVHSGTDRLVPGAWVALREAGADDPPAQTLATDETGTVHGRFLAPGRYQVEVRSAGRETVSRDLELLPDRGIARLDFWLE